MKAGMLLIFFVAAIFLQQNAAVYGFNQNRIRNGTETPLGMYDFLPALILINENPENKIESGICSSTIISKRHILTAAHCVIAFSNASMTRVPAVLVDYRPKETITVYLEGDEQKVQLPIHKFSVQPKIYVHQSYSGLESDMINRFYASKEPFLHDIAIIEFPEGTDLNIVPITLASGYVEEKGDTAIAAGYGIYNYIYDPNSKEMVSVSPTKLLNATVPIHLPAECNIGFVVPSLICTGIFTNQADHGDSGGPLFLQRKEEYYQIGVTSVGGNGTAFYVRVDKYCDWISKITKNEANCKPLPPPDPIVIQDVTPIQPIPQPLQPSSSILYSFKIALLFLFIGIFSFA